MADAAKQHFVADGILCKTVSIGLASPFTNENPQMKTHIAIASAAQCCLTETGQDARPDPVCIITMAQLLHTTYTSDAADSANQQGGVPA